MRLRVVERGHRIPQKLILGMIRLSTGRRVVDIIRTLLYRPKLFGRPMSEWTQAVMRGPSEWQVGERELFAAFTSRLNQCLF
ncbi:MAG TPA: peroxidase [Longimicrobiales bacterium]|nr:peroxidase [Longimicrobiales bacterium]